MRASPFRCPVAHGNPRAPAKRGRRGRRSIIPSRSTRAPPEIKIFPAHGCQQPSSPKHPTQPARGEGRSRGRYATRDSPARPPSPGQSVPFAGIP